jgi:hypothetical protein
MSMKRQSNWRTIMMAGGGLALAFALHALIAVSPALAAMDMPHSDRHLYPVPPGCATAGWWTDQARCRSVTCHNPNIVAYSDAVTHKTTATYAP